MPWHQPPAHLRSFMGWQRPRRSFPPPRQCSAWSVESALTVPQATTTESTPARAARWEQESEKLQAAQWRWSMGWTEVLGNVLLTHPGMLVTLFPLFVNIHRFHPLQVTTQVETSQESQTGLWLHINQHQYKSTYFQVFFWEKLDLPNYKIKSVCDKAF